MYKGQLESFQLTFFSFISTKRLKTFITAKNTKNPPQKRRIPVPPAGFKPTIFRTGI